MPVSRKLTIGAVATVAIGATVALTISAPALALNTGSTTSAASTATVINVSTTNIKVADGTYKIRSAANRYLLHSNGGRLNWHVEQWSPLSSGNLQHWQISNNTNGSLQLKAANVGLCIAPTTNALKSVIIKVTCADEPRQQWDARQVTGSTSVVFVNRASNLVLDIPDPTYGNGAYARLGVIGGSAAQAWNVLGLGDSAPTTPAPTTSPTSPAPTTSPTSPAPTTSPVPTTPVPTTPVVTTPPAIESTRVTSFYQALYKGNISFNNNTLRQSFPITAGGTKPRITLTNLFGASAQTVTEVWVGVQESPGVIKAGTLRQVTFNGSNSVTMAAGADATSDPVNLTVPDNGSLIVSTYMAQPTVFSGYHRSARATTYMTAGNTASSVAAPAGATTFGWWGLVKSVDLVGDTAKKTMVLFGDSITDGDGSTTNTNTSYPAQLGQRLSKLVGGEQYAIANSGLSGSMLLHDAPGTTTNFSALTRFQRDVLDVQGVSGVVVMYGINDVCNDLKDGKQDNSLEDMKNGYRQLIARGHAQGLKVYGATMTPFKGIGCYNYAGAKELVNGINEWILSGTSGYDGVVDFYSAIEDPNNKGAMLNGTTGDWLHPNSTGYTLLANAVPLAWFTK